MPEIRILPDNVANQIAAGEVVERPMSVVKELLENAIDAGATRISIGFRNGGKSFMSVEDNGCGMTRDQALLALERHATSKIRAASDLDEIRSFGFRGEALPSIASVSSFLLRTRTRDAELGTEILVEGGKYRACRENGMPAGTRIEISRLFFNVPARLKFLKSENTEAAHITRCVRLYAVAHPEIAFTLWENDREIFRSPAGTDLRERVGAIWGRQLADDLRSLDAAESAGMRVSGLIGKPGVSRASRAEMVTVVNGRPVDNRTMAYSLVESFHTLIPRGRYPLAFLFLEIDPHAVDVNVHPAKREVRFRNESAVRNLIISAVLKTLGGNVSTEISELDSLSFLTAERAFLKTPNAASATQLENYLKKYPKGAYTLPSHNYLGLYYYDKKAYDKARKELQAVLKVPNNPYTEETLARLADIQEKTKEYPEAYVSYQKLERIAKNKESRQNARLGMLRNAVQLGDNNAVIEISARLLADPTLSPEHVATARSARAKSFIARGDSAQAAGEWEKLAEDPRTETGAQSAYLLAQYYHDKGDDTRAEAVVNQLLENGTSHQYWLARSFIVLADVYARRGDTFKARQYLLSLQNNYTADDDIKERVAVRLEKLETTNTDAQ